MKQPLSEKDLEDKSSEELRAMMVEKVQGIMEAQNRLLKIYIDYLKEFIEIAKVLPTTPKPIDKLIEFLAKELDRLEPRCSAETLVPMLVSEFQDPALERKRKSQDSARSREFDRLMKAYHRYQPELITKMENLLARERAKTKELESKLAQQNSPNAVQD